MEFEVIVTNFDRLQKNNYKLTVNPVRISANLQAGLKSLDWTFRSPSSVYLDLNPAEANRIAIGETVLVLKGNTAAFGGVTPNELAKQSKRSKRFRLFEFFKTANRHVHPALVVFLDNRSIRIDKDTLKAKSK